jgi:tetratricopeptide (TPR) repeat protein
VELVFLLLTIIALLATIVFGFLQIIVPFIKGEVRLSKKFPFVEGAEATPKRRKRRKKKPKRRILIPIFAVIILIIIVVLVRFLVFQTTDTRRVPIAVMTFTNRTGDAQFDYLCEAIPNLLITNLEESKYLSVMTWERIHDLLKILGKKDMRMVGEDLGFELCTMDGVETVVMGSFTKLGNKFVTEVKVLEVSTKKMLKSSSSEGEGIESILNNQINELSRDIAKGASTYERVIKTTEFQIMEVTTTSMEAYNYFVRGRKDWVEFHYDDARRFLEKAIELDSTFAFAYFWLSYVYQNLRNYKARDKTIKKAKLFSDKVTEKERLYIEYEYASDVEVNQEKVFRILKQLTTKYPKEKRAHMLLAGEYRNEKLFYKAIEENNKALELDPNYGISLNDLGYIYIAIGGYDTAMEYFQRYAAAYPGDANPFDSMGDLYFQMGLLDRALAKYKQAIDVEPDYYSSAKIAYIYMLREDYIGAMEWISHFVAMAPSAGMKVRGYRYKAFFNFHLGNFNQAFNDLDTIKDFLNPTVWEYERVATNWLRGWMYYNMKKLELSRYYFINCYPDLNPNLHDSLFCIVCNNFPQGLIDLRQGNYNDAKVRLATIESLLPHIKSQYWGYKEIAQFFHNFLYTEILLAKDSLEKAIAVFEKTTTLELDITATGGQATDYNLTIMAINRDIIARAYLKKGEIDRTILEYERLIDPDPNKRGRCLIRPIWYYELAKLYEERGATKKAMEQYEKFLDIWNNADTDRPELIDARKRLASLQQSI